MLSYNIFCGKMEKRGKAKYICIGASVLLLLLTASPAIYGTGPFESEKQNEKYELILQSIKEYYNLNVDNETIEQFIINISEFFGMDLMCYFPKAFNTTFEFEKLTIPLECSSQEKEELDAQYNGFINDGYEKFDDIKENIESYLDYFLQYGENNLDMDFWNNMSNYQNMTSGIIEIGLENSSSVLNESIKKEINSTITNFYEENSEECEEVGDWMLNYYNECGIDETFIEMILENETIQELLDELEPFKYNLAGTYSDDPYQGINKMVTSYGVVLWYIFPCLAFLFDLWMNHDISSIVAHAVNVGVVSLTGVLFTLLTGGIDIVTGTWIVVLAIVMEYFGTEVNPWVVNDYGYGTITHVTWVPQLAPLDPGSVFQDLYVKSQPPEQPSTDPEVFNYSQSTTADIMNYLGYDIDGGSSGNGSSGSGSSGSGSSGSWYIEIVSISPSGSVEVEEGETVDFTVTVCNSSGNNYYYFYPGDGSQMADYMCESATISYTYTNAGTYEPDVEVYDLDTAAYAYGHDFALIVVLDDLPLD